MDLQIGLFCIVIAFLSALVIYIILSVSSIKEDSFEEAKANRRKIIKQYQDQSKTTVVKGKDKKVKKVNKTSKKSEDDENSSTKETEKDAFIVKEAKKTIAKAPEEVQLKKGPSNKEVENKKTSKAVKKIASTDSMNENTPPSVPVVTQQVKSVFKANSFEKQQQSKLTKKKNEDVPGKYRSEDDNTSAVQTIVFSLSEEPVKETKVAVQESATKIVTKPSKKKRSEWTSLHLLNNEKEAVNINLLLSLVQKAELSRTEIQLLIDTLLNKQQEDISEWLKGRQDPQVKLQKQLAEMELALKDEKQISAGFQAKLKELRNEINSDKANSRQTEELLSTVQNDCKSLSLKQQQMIEENQLLTAKIQQYEKQIAEEQLNIHKLGEELNVQQQIGEKKCHEAVINLQAQVNQYAAQSQELKAANNSLRSEIAIFQENDVRIQEEYREVNGNLERALSAATFDANTMRNELNKVERALADAESEIENLQGVINGLKTENQSIMEQNKQYLEKCSLVAKEYEILKQKESENIENGFTNDKKQNVAEYEARLEESCKLQQTLQSEVDVKNRTIEELNSSLRSLKNDFQNLKISSNAQNQDAKASVKKQAEQDEMVLQLKTKLSDRNLELENLRQELETSKQRNNELRSKNWKVVEALSIAEKKILNEQSSNGKVNERANDLAVRSCVERIVKHFYPELTIDTKKGSSIEEWLMKTEETVTSHSQDLTLSSVLQSQNTHLHSLVQNYKTIITETEGMLNRLQNHVEVEESRWKEKILTLEEEIELLKQENQCKYVLLSRCSKVPIYYETSVDVS